MNVQVLSDQVLLNHYLSGDRSAISQLIERHSRRVKDYIHMMVKDRDVADDIFQETFIKAVRVIDEGRYTDNGKFLSWILRIAHNQVIDHFRAQRQNKSVSESEAGYDVLGTLKLAERTVEDAMVCEQIERDVRALVELLPAEQRDADDQQQPPVADGLLRVFDQCGEILHGIWICRFPSKLRTKPDGSLRLPPAGLRLKSGG